jgi:protein-S-isoprenylcysteine O-methyltransferase Ste14
MTLATIGLVLLAPNVLALATLATLLVALELQVRRVEEPYLLRTHGDAYRRYAAATGRFFPGVGRLRLAGHSPSVSR